MLLDPLAFTCTLPKSTFFSLKRTAPLKFPGYKLASIYALGFKLKYT